MYGNTQRALLEFTPLSKWRILPRKGLLQIGHADSGMLEGTLQHGVKKRVRNLLPK